MLLLSPLFTFTTCHKQKETILNFTFTDLNSKQPIKDLELYLQEFDQDQFGNITNKITLDSYKTNELGNVYKKLKYLNPNKGHYIEWQKPSECYGTTNYRVIEGQENKYNRDLISNSYYKIHIKNINPFDENDKICYSYNKEATFANGCQTGSSVDFYVQSHDSGKKLKYIKSFITKNGNETIRLDSAYLNPCDTALINVFY